MKLILLVLLLSACATEDTATWKYNESEEQKVYMPQKEEQALDEDGYEVQPVQVPKKVKKRHK